MPRRANTSPLLSGKFRECANCWPDVSIRAAANYVFQRWPGYRYGVWKDYGEQPVSFLRGDTASYKHYHYASLKQSSSTTESTSFSAVTQWQKNGKGIYVSTVADCLMHYEKITTGYNIATGNVETETTTKTCVTGESCCGAAVPCVPERTDDNPNSSCNFSHDTSNSGKIETDSGSYSDTYSEPFYREDFYAYGVGLLGAEPEPDLADGQLVGEIVTAALELDGPLFQASDWWVQFVMPQTLPGGVGCKIYYRKVVAKKRPDKNEDDDEEGDDDGDNDDGNSGGGATRPPGTSRPNDQNHDGYDDNTGQALPGFVPQCRPHWRDWRKEGNSIYGELDQSGVMLKIAETLVPNGYTLVSADDFSTAISPLKKESEPVKLPAPREGESARAFLFIRGYEFYRA